MSSICYVMAAFSVKSCFFKGLGRGRLLIDDQRTLKLVSEVCEVAAASRIYRATELFVESARARDNL